MVVWESDKRRLMETGVISKANGAHLASDSEQCVGPEVGEEGAPVQQPDAVVSAPVKLVEGDQEPCRGRALVGQDAQASQVAVGDARRRLDNQRRSR